MKRKNFRVKLLPLTFIVIVAMLLSAALPAVAASTPTAVPTAPETVDQAVQRLNQNANGEVTVSYSPATGAVSFAAVAIGGSLFPTGESKTAEQQAIDFFADYGAAFGLTDARNQLVGGQVAVDSYGTTHVSYTQVQQGVPVFGSFLKAHFDAAGRMTAANGAIVPSIKVSTTPVLSAEQAGAIAVQELNRQLADPENGAPVSIDTRVLGSTLLVFRNGLLQGIPGSTTLVYEVEAGNGVTVREFFYVDAFSGKIVEQISGIERNQEVPEALSRQISEESLANVVWTNPSDPDPIPAGWAGGTDQQVIDWNDEADGAKETYNLFGSMAGRDSYDAAGAMMRTVNNDPGIACPNANWNSTSTNYCTGVTSDDVVSHEWGHAYTEYTSNLIYAWQPGAMNESYSDIWGEVADLINGRGTDTPGGLRTAGACSLYTTPPPVLTVNTPAAIAGDYPAGAASFGAPLTLAGLTGNVVLVDDGVGPGIPPLPATTDGCEPLVNAAAVAGNIAMVDRGTCAFTIKVKNAQDAGAVGVIVANHSVGGNGTIAMSGVDPTIVIPSLSVGYSNANLIKGQLGAGVNVTLHLGSGGTPDDSYRWLMGEDSTAFGGAIRDMWNPSCRSDPGRVSDQYYHCAVDDGGGVHTNSGVPNHAFSLMVDGGTYNSQNVTAIGLTKASHIFWRAQSTYLGPASGFPDLANSLVQSCSDLTGQNLNALSTSNATPTPSGEIISAADCAEVEKVSAAVEFTTPPTQCNFQPLLDPDAPALCSAGPAAVNTIWSETFSSGLDAWTLSSSFPFITPIDWESATPNPVSPASGGLAAFGVDPGAGTCSGGPGDYSGVMQMTSPSITIPTNISVPRLTFYNWVATEAFYDGGNVKISINGGTFDLLAEDAYTFNAYPALLNSLAQGNTNPLAGEPGFTGSDGGVLTGSWGQSQVNLATAGVAPGDTVQLRYDMGMDGCGGVFGWYVDDVNVYACEGAPINVTGTVTQTSSTAPTVEGTYVDVDVEVSNNGGALVDGLFLVPIDPDTEYVTDSAYGGASPLTATAAAQLAAEKGLTDLAARAANAAPDDVVAVAWMGPVATGEELMFGFTVKVTAISGEVQHDVAVYEGATFINAIVGSPVTIVDNSTYTHNRSRRFNVDRDTFIDGSEPGSFNGDAQTMWVGFYDQMRPVVHTRLDGIPTDAAVDTAYLYVYVYEGRGFANWAGSVIPNVQASPVTTEWMPDAANWWTPWTLPGGDYGMAGPSTTLGSGKIGTWLRLDVTAAAEDMLRSGFNQGFMLTSDDVNGVRYGLATKENWTGYVGYMRVYFRTAE